MCVKGRHPFSELKLHRLYPTDKIVRAMSSNPMRPLKIDQAQLGAKVGRHMLEFGRNPGNAADRRWLMQHINDIYTNPTQVRDGTFSGQGAVLPIGSNARGPVWFYAKGNDVVVTDHSDNFVTILKNGVINNTSFLTAKTLPGRP